MNQNFQDESLRVLPTASAPAGQFMSRELGALSLEFVIHAQRLPGEVLDLGCGTGIATISVLQRGGHVCAVDPVRAYLEALRSRVPREQHPRLRTEVAALPGVDFPDQSFAAIHAGYVLQLLQPSALEQALQRIQRWLRPGGKFFASAVAPLTQESLRRALRKTGYQLDSMKALEASPTPDGVPGFACIARRCGLVSL